MAWHRALTILEFILYYKVGLKYLSYSHRVHTGETNLMYRADLGHFILKTLVVYKFGCYIQKKRLVFSRIVREQNEWFFEI